MGSEDIPAGWYPDAAGGERWWDGQGWTDHTRPAPGDLPSPPDPTTPMDPVPSSAAPPSPGGGGQPAGGPPPPAAGTALVDEPPRGGGGKLALIIGLVLLLLLGAAIALLVVFTGLFGSEDEPEDEAVEPVDEVEDEIPADEPDPVVGVGDIREVAFGDQPWRTSCVGREDNPTARSSSPEVVELSATPGGVVWQHENPILVDGQPAVFPLYEVRLGEPIYGDVTGSGADDVLFRSSCSQELLDTVQIEAWTLQEGQPLQLGSFFEVPSDLVTIVDIRVEQGRVRVVAEDARDGDLVRRVDDWVPVGQAGWGSTEVSRELLEAAPEPEPQPEPDVPDDRVVGVEFGQLGPDFVFAPRNDPRDPFVATQPELSIVLTIHPDGSRLEDLDGVDDMDDLDERVAAWADHFEELAEDDGVTLDDPLVRDVEVVGADRAALLAYDGSEATTSFVVLVVEVDGIVVEVTASLNAEDWDADFRPDTESFFATFRFDAALLGQMLGP